MNMNMNMNMNMTNEKEQILKAIKDCELKADIEIVPAILEMSDSYHAAHFRLGIFCAVFVTAILYLSPLLILNPLWYFIIQLISFIVGYFLAFHSFLKKMFITKSEATEEVYQRSIELFYEEKVHCTEKRNGILVFISAMERKIEIRMDIGLINFISEEELKVILQKFTVQMKKQNPYLAMKECIEAISLHFESKLPRNVNNNKIIENSLTDHLRQS